MLDAAVCHRALDSRDARFDGVFFVGITTTRIYCRPICPARVSYPDRRRFFESAGAAEGAGFRPCLRCRPELAPGLALCETVSRLARAATLRIAGGALNGRSVAALAREFNVSDRHLRRALEHELGLSPTDLAQTHRLLLAKQLLGETALPVTRIAYASGFQSLRRFNAVFRERYGLNPSAVRRAAGSQRTGSQGGAAAGSLVPASDAIHISLGYRAPFAWNSLLELLAREAVPGVELIEGGRYARTVQLDGHRGVIVVSDTARDTIKLNRTAPTHLDVALSPALLPVVMPLLARLRELFDLDSQPLVVDAHLAAAGLKSSVRARPGLRAPGTLDGFEIALRTLIGGAARSNTAHVRRVSRVVRALGAPIDSDFPQLQRLMPTVHQISDAGVSRLRALGVSPRSASALVAIACALIAGDIALDPGADAAATHRALIQIDGITERAARTIVMRALHGPDAFPAANRALNARAERYRPWRAYAALHLFS